MASRLVERTVLLVALLIWLPALVVSVAWLSSLVSTSGDDIVDPDYMWRPLSISHGMKVTVGLASTAMVVVCGLLFRRSFEQGALTRTGRSVLIPASAIAIYVGLTYAVATEPVVGANIGGGLMLLAAAPFVLAMAITAIAMVRQGRRSASQAGEPAIPER